MLENKRICSLEECDELAKRLLQKPPVNVLTTLMGWFPEFDDLGRALNADPNIQDYIVKDEDKFYHINRCGWKVRIYETQNNEMYPGKSRGELIYCIDETPDYMKINEIKEETC